MKALLVSPDPGSREVMRLTVASIERRLGRRLEFFEAIDGERGIVAARHESPEVIVADEIASRAGGFALTRDLKGGPEPFEGIIVILLERRQDAWLARWSGADAWFVKPVDPFELADRVLELVSAKEHA